MVVIPTVTIVACAISPEARCPYNVGLTRARMSTEGTRKLRCRRKATRFPVLRFVATTVEIQAGSGKVRATVKIKLVRVRLRSNSCDDTSLAGTGSVVVVNVTAMNNFLHTNGRHQPADDRKDRFDLELEPCRQSQISSQIGR
ncbi:hypothetical protein MHU86_5524 [Fragilaria crotonensis]|nr:hypothetical protein MHU86_5524 [Fragilaria crotonensis]